MPTNPFIGTVPGAGGSFPMGGVRSKIKSVLAFTTSSIWVCPVNVYEITIAMCGGGGGGASGGTCDSATTTGVYTAPYSQYYSGQAAGGGGGGSGGVAGYGTLAVVPSTSYTITIAAGGAASATGGTTSFVGGLLYITTIGGNAGSGGQTSTGDLVASDPCIGYGYVSASAGGAGAVTSSLAVTTASFYGTFTLINGASGGKGGTGGWHGTAAVMYGCATEVSVSGMLSGSTALFTPGASPAAPDNGGANTGNEGGAGGGGGASLFSAGLSGAGGRGAQTRRLGGYYPSYTGSRATGYGGGGGGGGGASVIYSGSYIIYSSGSAAGGAGGTGLVQIMWEQ